MLIYGMNERPSSSLSDVVDITFTLNGEEVQPISSIEICFDVPADDNSCLGYFDTKTRSWICQDKCLKRKGNSVCGETDHLTNFAILLSGNGGGGCGDDENYIFGSIEEDAILIGCIVAALWFCLVLFVLFALYTRPGRHLLYGSEGTRVSTLRRKNRVSVSGY